MSAFPPSSPFLDHHEQEADDPFNSFSARGGQHKKLVINTPFNKFEHNNITNDHGYPTPNPSSSIGNRSSSPARHQESAPVPRSSSNVSEELEPAALVLSHASGHSTKSALNVLLYPEEKITIGRSSRCDYFLKSKFASREHMDLYYDGETNALTVRCTGYNGLTIHFGQTLYGVINEMEEKTYFFEKKAKGDIKDDSEIVEELSVIKGEQLTVPYNSKIRLEVKGTFVAISITNAESETEDEMPVLHKRLSSIKSTDQTKQNKSIESNQTFSLQAQGKEPAPLLNTLQTPLNKPIRPLELVPKKHLSRSSTPCLKSSSSMDSPVTLDTTSTNTLTRAKSVEPENLSPQPKHQVHTHKRAESIESRIPLQPKSDSTLNKQQRRRKADPGLSPQKKKPDTKQREPKEKIESLDLEAILSTIEDVSAVQNVLSNHLAFSRISQTPLNQLQTISGLTQAMTRQQLRAVLASTPWIGVIYRRGKDAAGKYLDEEYYYDVEKDTDPSRVQLVSSIKGSSGLRNCRKTHKQYYWKKPVSRK